MGVDVEEVAETPAGEAVGTTGEEAVEVEVTTEAVAAVAVEISGAAAVAVTTEAVAAVATSEAVVVEEEEAVDVSVDKRMPDSGTFRVFTSEYCGFLSFDCVYLGPSLLYRFT